MNVTPGNSPLDDAKRFPVRCGTGRLMSICLAASCVLHLGLLVYSQAISYTPSARLQTSGISIELLPYRAPEVQPAATQYTAEADPAVVIQEVRSKNSRIPAPSPMQSGSETPPDSNTTVSKTATPAEPGNASERQDIRINDLLQAAIRHAMKPHFKYPILARRRGWEGIVKVALRVEPDGMISQLHIIEPSRHPILDRAAMDSLRNTEQLAGMTEWLAGNHFDIVLPIEYQLL